MELVRKRRMMARYFSASRFSRAAGRDPGPGVPGPRAMGPGPGAARSPPSTDYNAAASSASWRVSRISPDSGPEQRDRGLGVDAFHSLLRHLFVHELRQQFPQLFLRSFSHLCVGWSAAASARGFVAPLGRGQREHGAGRVGDVDSRGGVGGRDGEGNTASRS